MEKDEQPACSQASKTEHKAQGLQYNHRMMAFLNLQLDRVKGLPKPSSVQLEEWQSFDLYVQKGFRLLARHACPFNVRTFYKVDDAYRAVNEICRYLKVMAQKWQVNCRMELEDSVPQNCMEEDRNYLHKMLAYILKGSEEGADGDWLRRWLPIKCRHEEQMRSLQIQVISEDVLLLKEQLGKGGYGLVRKAEWNFTKVAVKTSLREGDLPIEEFASIVKEVMMHANLRHPNIAQVYAATPSGWMVMELADKDLGAMCHGKELNWCSARNILLQATKGLCHLHSLDPPVVHSDVKTSNFLIFGEEPSSCTVKVTDFGLAVEAGKSRSRTVRVGQGTLEWMAPEIFERRPSSVSSDVYSLGVIMYEVMTGEYPYGTDKLDRFCNQQAVLLCEKMFKKSEPCKLGPEHCPEGMRSFMQRCVSTNPSERPTMEEISMYLQQLPADWSPPSQATDEEPVQIGQKRKRKDGPQSVGVNGIAEKLDISDIQQDAKLRRNWVRGVHKLLTWSSHDIVIEFGDAEKGCVVFPMQIEFPDGHSTEQFKQQMQTGSALLFQADLNLIAYQPRLELRFRDERYIADCQVSELESEVHRFIRKCSEVVDVKYSCQMMHFLQTEIGRMAGCSLKLPDGGAALDWKEDAAVVLHYLKFAHSLLKQHTFVDLNNLQKTTDTRMAIERVLGHTSSFVSKWGFHEAVHIQTAVGAELVQHDSEIMEKCLGYVLEGSSCSFEEFATTHRQEWEEFNQSCSEQRQRLEVIAKKDVKWLSMIVEDVHLAEWRNAKVAIKQVIPAIQEVMNLEDYSKFYTWMLNRTILDPEHVVRLLGVARSGAVLMELADSNLSNWCASQPRISGGRLDVAMKVRLLLQAAKALCAVHHLGITYGDLKSSKFLIFRIGGSHVTVKIAQLKLSAEPWQQDAGPSWTGRWIAKELYEGRVPSLPSDVFSFGTIMYEVMMQELPYGEDATEAEIMDKKFKGLEPVAVPEDVKQEWPNGLLKLMRLCCSSKPEQRPSMKTVCSFLEGWSSEQCDKFKKLPKAKYNKRIMGFLDQQLARLQDLEIPPGAAPEALEKLDKAIETGKRLLDKHRESPDIRKLYHSEEARTVVEGLVCTPIQEVAQEWKTDGDLKLEICVPEGAVEQDRDELSRLLEFVLQERGVRPGIDSKIPREWHECRDNFLGQVQHLIEVDDEKVDVGGLLGQGGFSFVHDCMWEGIQVAGKKPKLVDGMTPIECQADLLKDALNHHMLSEDHVPKLHAITKSGMLLMELADSDLKSFCKTHSLKWPFQLGLLVQAAKRLRHLHSRDPPMVHCDVKSSNFLVFGENAMNCTVKIADFGVASEDTATRCNTARKPQGSPLWVAPERWHGEVLSIASDVYSFGLVMYDLIARRPLYDGVRDNAVRVINMKVKGIDPCIVDEDDCPRDMQQLMRDCCRPAPEQRPTIEDVCIRLSVLQLVYQESNQQTLTEMDVCTLSIVKLAFNVRVHYATLKPREKRNKQLIAGIHMLERTVVELRQHYRRDAPDRIKRALTAVEAELVRVDALFRDLKNKGILEKIFEDPSTTEYWDIENSLKYAVNVLDLAQGWNHSQRSKGLQRRAQELLTLTGSADLILEKLNKKLSSEDEIPFAQQIDSDEVRYNQDIMQFLQTQLDKIDIVLSTTKYLQLLQQMQGGGSFYEGEVKQNGRAKWQESTRELAHAWKLGYLLIGRHKQPFNLTTFYKVFEARDAVQMICEMLQTFVRKWHFPSVEIQNFVPPDRVHRDKVRLAGYLTYVLYGGECAFMNDHQKEEWMLLKSRVQGWFDLLPMAVEHGDLQLVDSIDSIVYKGIWKGSPVAVKRLATGDDPATLEVEDFAEFFTTIVALAKIRSNHVVDIIGATETGMILMELGHTDLFRWLDSHYSEGLATKLGLLLQAAKGLWDVHKRKFVHRAVRTRKFVIFGDQASPTVKVAGFGLAIFRGEDEASDTLRTSVRHDREAAWVAPEIFDGKAHTAASDIYSFGIVLYHVVGGIYPYGRRASTAQVMRRVLMGELPRLPDDMGLPEKLLRLMQMCCSLEPTDRPADMQEVCDDLNAIYDDLTNSP